MTQRRSIRTGRSVMKAGPRRAKGDRRRGGAEPSFKARVLIRGDTMKEVQENNATHEHALEGRTIGSDPWTIIVYLDEICSADPPLWVRTVGLRDALLRVSVWSHDGERRCCFVHRLHRGSVISLRDLVQLGGVVLQSGHRVELFRLENSGPVQVVARNVAPAGRLA